ncbi:polysaccharide biosynthesis/export family protein [Hyphomicrobium sp.]|uniref:polysaccharide biosynthesis/export family protein n=1 Tax=Hyphomicrobium sp. TaxID=82 RepID=UPI002B703DE0|nr:polysaccharide biosynthesis/export family protein [Hyphomicrobium sp.]HVX35196.1 polysaccharide biosynthesis/export family protein [Hyphomicrobium sp.]HVZ03556.1 polysaccharide biosynthesis/export family protein [Hyphomicrobium sp.]
MFVVGQSDVRCPSWSRIALVFALPIIMAGCALPAAAPTALELAASTDTPDFKYSIVKMDTHVVSELNHYHPTFGASFRNRHYGASNALAAGDVIAITVYETGGQALFPPPSVVSGAAASAASLGQVATGASNIPPQVIESDGTIFVPFVGRVKIGGLTPGQAGAVIQRDLQGKSVSPQVMVSLINNIGNAATVSGEVNLARPVPLSSRGERLLDVIAAAGGAKFPAYETYVQVMRNKEVGKVLLQTVVNNPAENIIVAPRDQIYLIHDPRRYAVFGATQRVSTYPFMSEKVTLAEAIAQAGGPIDLTGDPSGIYLFRFEPWFIAKDILDPEYIASLGSKPPEFVPVLYRVDLRSAEGYFLAQSVQMRDKDVILITNAEATQLTKALALVRGFTGIASDIGTLRRQYLIAN